VEGNPPSGLLDKLKEQDEEDASRPPEPLGRNDPDHSMSNKQ
jgi:hypothetical protein